ncbi:putative LON peptidase N-terminal domain and RING finger protein 3-like [Apostichopus japonicus]|uniref:Putative LON peptidase N-terminal domain and RING finger protein 3-like n=1 Tax=Stichopus japonicus TaxID=307972 RepID=A0A2G8KP40_STIJA|nr:putative LON peptidase N-terminal domain and RING finger protein 3-like [Apostichopus japonicus]
MEMVDLAREAFRCSNYDLAIGIYDKLLSQHGLNMEWLVGKASSLAKQNRFNEAVNAMHYACRLGGLQPCDLMILVEPMVDYIARIASKAVYNFRKKDIDVYSCGICLGILFEPITLPCGHSFCKDCLREVKRIRTCQTCKAEHPLISLSNMQVNVILRDGFEKYFTTEMKARRLKQDGNNFVKNKQYPEALERYTAALQLDPLDHLSLSNRAHVYLSMNYVESALQDADMVCRLRPNWPKGYYRKGAALVKLSRFDSALMAYLQCLTLDPTIMSAKEAITEVMYTLLTQQQVDPIHHLGSDIMYSNLKSPREADIGSPLNILNTCNLSELITTLVKLLVERVEQDMQQKTDGPPSTTTTTQIQDVEMQVGDADTVAMENTDADQCTVGKVVTAMGHIRMSDGPSTSSSKELPPQSLWCSLPNNTKKREIESGLVKVEDFECSLCYRLFYHPVTTPCGHTFCRGCLYRSLDYSNGCPLCKGCLAQFLSSRCEAETEVTASLIKNHLLDKFQQRQAQQHQEWDSLSRSVQGSLEEEIPIFVCIQAFPTIPCPLHIFEPRYRLMIRQCVESGSMQFGMCIPAENGFSECGVMLEIREVRHLEDGRSIVDTVGGRRFRVKEQGMRDGYNTAKVQFIQDIRVEGETLERVHQLHDTVYEVGATWFCNLLIPLKVRIEQHFGPMPDKEIDLQEDPNGPRWVWWLSAILPIDPTLQLQIVSKTSLLERLQMLQNILTRVSPR